MITASEKIIANLRRLREQRKMTWVELSERMAALGHPIPPLSLRRIDRGQRRIDIDELVAFGTVFSVEPWSLTGLATCDRCSNDPPKGYSCLACSASTPGEPWEYQ